MRAHGPEGDEMTAQKHTLEPWQVRTDLDGKPKLDSRDGYTVERADPTAGKPFVVSTWSLTNARLIAAAPEMLEALMEIEAAATEASVPNNAARILSASIHRARAAIAKAEEGL